MLAKSSVPPPTTHEMRPERKDVNSSFLEDATKVVAGHISKPFLSHRGEFKNIISKVSSFEEVFQLKNDGELKTLASELRQGLRREGFQNALVAQSFALIREVSGRTIGMRHYETQLMGGLVLLKGMVAEMETGEGKTLTATLAAATAALSGIPVHILTVNDYLTARDAEIMSPLYNFLGLSVGSITHEVPPNMRRQVYESDITYCTNKEITFDYLRDTMTLSGITDPLRLKAESLCKGKGRVDKLLLRGLHFAIVDEADSILIDESRTPLIISGQAGGEDEEVFLRQASNIAESLEKERDYKVVVSNNIIELTEKGVALISELATPLGGLWVGTVRQKEIIKRALSASVFFRRDEHYLVSDGKVQIIDEFTGRVMVDRSWEQGLQQLIEIKEGCDVTKRRETLARISYQRFFRRYLHLAGMTGTAREVKGELSSVYGLKVMRLKTNRPLIRRAYPDNIFKSREEKWKAITKRVIALHKEGRPILVGTRTVLASEHLSSLLSKAGLEHKILNAKNDEEEAQIVASAGEAGRVTIATNMAGRGTDIKLNPLSLEKKGLHVILTERHDAARIDRQLEGRCGRQGDPGSYEAFLSLEDNLFEGTKVGLSGEMAKRLNWLPHAFWTYIAKFAILRAQKKVERLHVKIRKELFKQDRRLGDLLSFSGRSE